MQIDIYQLHKNRNERMNRRKITYQEVLNKCYKRIEHISNKSYDTFCYYVIPEIMFGVPLYDKNECIKFVFEMLVNKGFKIIYLHPNVFYISWEIVPEKKEEIVKKIEDKKVKNISEYKPTGNFIYSNTTLNSIKNKY